MQTFLLQALTMNIEKPYKCDICNMIITMAVFPITLSRLGYIYFIARVYL